MANSQVPSISPLGGSEFPFKGQIHAPGTEEYIISRQKNYAYNSKYQDEMYPAYFAYPENGEFESILSAISFGKKTGLHIMGRSGGHQYAGVSSDSGSIIIDMQEWNTIGNVLDSENVVGLKLALKYPKLVTVGVGVTLGDLAKRLSDEHCTIPMGECPSVCVGGHMQTGGWGHLARSNGLFTEYVRGFTIITAEGIKRVSYESTGRELDLYKAVRGGSPGAFGIITDVTILPLCDDVFPNARSYGQIVPIVGNTGYESISEVMSFFLETMNKIGNSSEALGINLNFSHIARAVPPSIISKTFGCLVPIMTRKVEVLLVEATIIDDTDVSSMAIFQECISRTEEVKHRTKYGCVDKLMSGAMMLLSSKTLKDGRRRMPLSVINESFVRETPFVTEKTQTNPQQRVNEFPFQGQALYPKGDTSDIPINSFLHGEKNAVTKGAQQGLLNIYKSCVDLVGHGMPIDMVASQNYFLGTKRVVGPFPGANQWSKKIRGTLGFDQFGPNLSDPRVWQVIKAFYDLEREYILKPEKEMSLCLIAFTSDANCDTSEGGCIKSLPSLNLNDKRVQERYYDPDSKYGFDWVANVKHEWDDNDIFHSRFTIPPLKSTSLNALKSEVGTLEPVGFQYQDLV